MAAPDPSAPERARTSGLAVASVLFGLLSLVVWILGSIPGIVCGVIGLGRIAGSAAGPGPLLKGRGLAITGIVLSTLGLVVAPILLLVPALLAVDRATDRLSTMNSLKMLSLSMYTAQEMNGRFPGDILDADGAPLLSWRVAILPYLGDEAATALHKEFRLDEPWDSEHNQALLARMPDVFATPRTDPTRGLTAIVVPVAPGTAFGPPADSGAGGNFAHDLQVTAVRDGLSNTAGIVWLPGLEIPWTKPEDLDGDPAAAFAADGPRRHRFVILATCDGAVHTVSAAAAPDVLRALFSRAGDDSFSFDDL